MEYKSYTTRTFPVELHTRLKRLAADKLETMENVFNEVIEAGLNVVEARWLQERVGGKTNVKSR